MKRLIADIHMHTLASGHAYGTIREMAAAAKEQQLQLIGISEHAGNLLVYVYLYTCVVL